MKGSGDGRCAQPLTAAGCRGSCAPAGAAARFWPSSLLLSLTAPGRAPGDGLPASDGHPKVLGAEKTAWVCISPCTLCRAKRGLCLAQRQRQCLCHEHPGETRVWNSPQTFPSHKDTVRADPAMGCHGWLSGWPLKCPQSRFSALALPFRLLGEAWAPLLPASPRCTAEPGTCTGRGCPPAAPAAAGVSRQPPRATRGNVCSVSRQPQLLSLPPLQGRGVMRTCITLLGSDRALRNPRSSAAGAGGGCEGTPLLPAGARHPPPAEQGWQAPAAPRQRGWGRKFWGSAGCGQGCGAAGQSPHPPPLCHRARLAKGWLGLSTQGWICSGAPQAQDSHAEGISPFCPGGEETPGPSSSSPSPALSLHSGISSYPSERLGLAAAPATAGKANGGCPK